MRIAYVINSLEGGGAALPLPAILRLLRDEGADVRLFALGLRDGRAAPALDAAGVDRRTAPGAERNPVRAAIWLRGELAAFRTDLIWTSLTQATVTGQFVGALVRAPVVSWQHNAFLKPANLQLLRLTRSMTRLWVADSDAVADLTAARMGVPRDAVAVWPLVVAEPSLRPRHARARGEPFRIGSLGRLHPNKGYDVLIAALALLLARRPDLSGTFTVDVAGDGAERGALEAAALSAGVRSLRFGGFQDDPGLWLADLHGYVQPSRAEGLCIALHEALQAGLPSIVADVGEMARTVRDSGAGWVVPPDDPRALAQAFEVMLGDPEDAAARGAKGRAWVTERYSPAAFAASGREVLRRIARIA